MIEFSKAYFIKLGRSGDWEKEAIEGGYLRLGYPNPFHKECLARNYDAVRPFFEGRNKTKTVVTNFVNQIRTFYEADRSVLWITFYQRRLWWGVAEDGIELIPDESGSRIRRVVGGWKSEDIMGGLLSVERISGRLTKVQMYQGTICEVKEALYLKNKLNAIEAEEIQKARKSLVDLVDASLPLIKSLTWKDFELLVDLIFLNSGWKRIGVLGKNEKDIDLDLMMPVNGRRVFVQVKSASCQTEFEEYVAVFEENDMYDEMYFVVHSLKGDLVARASSRPITIINDLALAELVVKGGLIEWLIEKAT